MAKGDETAMKKVIQATLTPPTRRPANQNNGNVTTDVSPPSARTATSLRPKTSIQKWSIT
jgi:hypothetical protein